VRRGAWVTLSAVLASILGSLPFFRSASAQSETGSAAYSPYSSSFLSPDMQWELQRVHNEIDRLEQNALAQWQALPTNTETPKRPIQKQP
jgi:hypothetical protein